MVGPTFTGCRIGHGSYESRSCPLPLGRSVSRKAGKTKKTKRANSVFVGFSPTVEGKGLIKRILPLQAFMTVSLIPAGIHPDKILD